MAVCRVYLRRVFGGTFHCLDIMILTFPSQISMLIKCSEVRNGSIVTHSGHIGCPLSQDQQELQEYAPSVHHFLNSSRLIFVNKFSNGKMPFSGMLRTVTFVITYVSEERIFSIIRLARIGDLGTTLKVIRNRSMLLAFLVRRFLSP
jgi:hypothetical protein